MTADISLSGEQYQIDVDSNGDLVIKDSSDTVVLKHTDGGAWSINTAANVNDLTDSTSGNTVYNSSTEQLGDGNQNADLNNVVLQDILDTASGNTVYDSSTETLGDGNQSGDFDSVNTAKARITESVTVYVRDDGDDANLGDTPENAKATIQSALDDAPVQGRSTGILTVDIGPGTFSYDLFIDEWDLNRVQIAGAGDVNSADTTTLQPGNDPGLKARQAYVTFDNVHLSTTQSRRFASAETNAWLEVETTCSVDHGTERAFYSADKGHLSVACDFEHNTDDQTGPIIGASGGLFLGGQITQTGSTDTEVITLYDGSGRCDIQGALIGLGSGTTRVLIRAQSPRHIKLGDVAHEGAERLISGNGGAEIIAQDDLTQLTDITRVFGNQAGGWFHEPGDGSFPTYFSLPPASDGPAPSGKGIAGSSDVAGTMYYDFGPDAPMAHSRNQFADHPMINLEIDSATASDVPTFAFVFDPSNSRVLFKDNSGTVHYWNTDGTL